MLLTTEAVPIIPEMAIPLASTLAPGEGLGDLLFSEDPTTGATLVLESQEALGHPSLL